MADTIRTEAALLALFADNTTGDISAQDLRDFVVSIYDYTKSGARTLLNFGAADTVNVSSNQITVSQTNTLVNTSGAEQTVGIINGGTDGDVVILAPSSNANALLLDDSVASTNISVPGGAVMRFQDVLEFCVLKLQGSTWYIVASTPNIDKVQGAWENKSVVSNAVDVTGLALLEIDSTGTPTVNTFTGGETGQALKVKKSGGNNVTLAHSAGGGGADTFRLESAANKVLVNTTDMIEVTKFGTTWQQSGPLLTNA